VLKTLGNTVKKLNKSFAGFGIEVACDGLSESEEFTEMKEPIFTPSSMLKRSASVVRNQSYQL
jgi:hypothetical protein